MRKITQNVVRVTKESDKPFSIFFDKVKNKLISITVVGPRKILNTFDMRGCLHTFIATKRSIKNKLVEVEGARAPMPRRWRRQWLGLHRYPMIGAVTNCM